MKYPLESLCGTGDVRAPGHDLAFLPHDFGAAHRALPGHLERLLPAGPLLDDDLHDLGYHVTRLVDEHPVADADVLPLHLVLVVPVSYTHLRAHETRHDLVCRLL